MLPNNQESKKKKGIKKIFAFFKSKKKDKDTSDNLSEIEEISTPKTQEPLPNQTPEKNISGKTIILIGSTGSGKSTLANVISGTEKFIESGSSISVTREVQREEFTESGINYVAIDTVGIGDTQLKREEVLDKLAEAVYLAREGISQVIFVISGRFDEKEIANYSLLKSIIFDNSVVNHTTVIRTNFSNFGSEEECKEDKKSLLTHKELSKIINSCNGIVHVDNPSLDLDIIDDEDKKEIEERKITRSKSREILLKHLKKVCQNQESPYQPSKLQKLSDDIFSYMEEKIRKRKELEEKRKRLGLEIKRKEEVKVTNIQVSTAIKNDENDFKGISQSGTESNETKLLSQQEEKTPVLKIFSAVRKSLERSGDIKTNLKKRTDILREEIKELEEVKKLKEEIAEKEETIRKEVLKHIFNNYNEIAEVAGGNTFISSIVGDSVDLSNIDNNFDELWNQLQELEKSSEDKEDLMILSLEEIEVETEKRERELIELNKQLLNYKEVFGEWQKQGFSIEEVNEWANALRRSFNPENDALFCAWLRDDKKLTTKVVLNYVIESIKQLKEEYYSEKVKKDFELLLKSAESGDSLAQYKLGDCYLDGIGVEKDEYRAFVYYMKSADMGNSNGMLKVGDCYQYGAGVEKDKKKAFDYYLKAAGLGNQKAMNDVGNCYQHGIGVEKNFQKAFEYYKRPADLGNASAICNVGHCYANGKGVYRDYNKAFEYYRKSADMGVKEAMHNIARFYRNGIGTKRDIQSANYWFRKYRSLLKTNKSPDHINLELKRILDDERFKLSWIDYNDFRDIRKIGKGGFATVYYANWFDRINGTWNDVALKVIHDSNKNEQEFIQELKNHCEIGYENPSFLNYFGVSRNNYGDYIIVMEIALKGSLRQNLVEVSRLEWKDKLNLLNCIASDLEAIHSQELVHRDLHSGNILQDYLHSAHIADLALAKVKEGKICGILPYIAPEILVGQPYAKASDIYSLGVIATEISTGQRAFDGIPFSDDLTLRIINGFRPECLGPDCYINLAMKCMDKDFDKRPTATEIVEIIARWLDEMDQEDDNEIKKQFLEVNRIKPEPIKQIHSQDVYDSDIYDTESETAISEPISLVEISDDDESEYQSQVEVLLK
ncbi:putative Non-specific protein-tyrosine kinase [endosymbiont DhMRE of Dentiscutata heterogama]|uniref:protein kinase n=1 Tax=endosymbiont DhMRE of Dentiscutata heterogama TaxID=1609546 RepID=UPI000629D35C|nr:protein kinase [endosymbiont DhMRE of Dentiscutata heterogama]CFW93320.1 putative Non-specific protein-tyrosine kinase [endosymbiont DhMRE of Dentiscutata heterogama]